MTVKFIGHACFLFTGSSGVKIIIDPYEPGGFGGAIGYGRVTDEADVVLVTHEHADHSYVTGVPGEPVVCREACEACGITFRVVEAPHDDAEGRKRGNINMFAFELDGVRVCHAGDLGDVLTPAQVSAVGPVDVLMVPVGGTYTLSADQAWAVVQQLAPRIVIPMHYKTAKTNLPLAPLERFTNGKPHVTRTGSSTLEVNGGELGEGLRVVVLDPAN